jgi:hypothetical protein
VTSLTAQDGRRLTRGQPRLTDSLEEWRQIRRNRLKPFDDKRGIEAAGYRPTRAFTCSMLPLSAQAAARST